jgi:putative endonuclease
MAGCWFYILRCADGSYYVGTSRSDDLETRISQHDQGTFGGYTANRRPVALVYSVHFNQITDALHMSGRSKAGHEPRRRP